MADHVLITGGSLNIGAAITRRALEDGIRPIVLDVAEPEIEGDVEFHRVDLADLEATEALLRELVRDRAITRLVNNVGVVCPGSLGALDFADFETVMNLNLRTAILCAQTLLPGMREAGFGRIVNNASRTVLGKEKRSFYAASKAALIAAARTWALELAADGITANVVAPGTIATTAFDRNNPPDDPQTRAIIKAIPARRIGTPDDVAQAVSFFLDARSGFVNGQVVYVCGGLTVGRAPV